MTQADKLRLWRHDALLQHHYATAVYIGDKVLTMTNDPNDAFWLAQVYYSKGDYQMARNLLSGSQFEESVSCRYLSGLCLLKLEKYDEALDVVGESNPFKKDRSQIIIFVNYKKSCEIVGNTLSDMGFRVAIMHGSKSQRQREEAINDLKSGRANILVATDVAGRGIDIPNISLVVNYQMSKGIEEYTHRIGRTGRAGRKGTAITFWNEDSDREVLYDRSSTQ